ncbi:hypothetical protein FRB91_008326 [Serendipita sp. 411]|nr:hypothetical protein FRB91_008326 [Serendipita sp. 411]
MIIKLSINHLFLTTLCNSLTWHDFAPTPVEPKFIPQETKVNPQATGDSSTATGPPVDEAIVLNDPPKPAVFEHPTTARPKRILDLGCGSGAWVMDAAKVWTDARFVGLDLVPIQPNLSIVAPQLKDRIEWVNANL